MSNFAESNRQIILFDCKVKASLSDVECREWGVTKEERQRARNYLQAVRMTNILPKYFGVSSI